MKYFDLRTGFLLVVSGVLLGAILFQHKTMLASITQSTKLNSQYLSEKRSAHATIEEMQLMREYYPVFLSLIDSNKLLIRQSSDLSHRSDAGESSVSHRKIRWIKLLESAKNQLDITEMSFEIYPYQLIEDEIKKLAISVGTESIILRVSLLHDGVLVNLLDYLSEHAPVPFVLTSIEIERTSEKHQQKSEKQSVDQITAEIVIKWYLIEMHGENDDISS